jgi:hypothetical protein
MTTPFLTDLAYIQHLLHGLAQQKEDGLPRDIQLAHFIGQHGNPNCWEDLEREHPEVPALDAVSTLCLVINKLDGLEKREMARAREEERLVKGLTRWDLKLGKMRNSS